MCGIFAIFGIKGNYIEKRKIMVKHLKRLLHRGPEYTGIANFETSPNNHTFLCHERLAIVAPQFGEQPQWSTQKTFCTVVNGEIYNHIELYKEMKGYENIDKRADCEVVCNMFEYYGDVKRICNMLSGKWSCIVYDVVKNRFWVMRDHIGIIPCYLGRGKNGEVYVSNELKAIHDVSRNLEILLPGINNFINFIILSLFNNQIINII